MDSIITHILALSLVLVFSPYLSKVARIQTTPIEIIIGSILGYLGLIGGGEGNEGSHYFDLIAEVGFLYLMFLAGLEINLKSIAKMPKDYIVKAINFLVVLMILTPIVGHFIFKFNYIITVALPLISVGLLATLSKEHSKNTSWINIALLIGAIGEVLSITALTILEVAIAVGFSTELIYKISILFLFLLTIVGLYHLIRLIFWWYPELKNKMMPRVDNQDQDFRLAIGIFFFMIVVMKMLHLELAFGAFIAGLFISTFFHHKKQLENKITSFGFGFLIPIFFIHVGSSFDYGYFVSSIFIAIKILIAMILIKFLASLVLIRLLSLKELMLVALSLSMPLTLLVATATVGYRAGIMQDIEYNALILASILEVIIFMVGIKFISKL
ncbi:MAG: cation:proton antiporter [Epsilonproteobacteria bacterium]|nr:cation:proton antiporter [Campylobacterota bacterium]